MSQAELTEIETIVNREIRHNAPAQAQLMAKDEALAAGAMALFGEKYGDQVRVLSIGDFSVELCGGTHVQRAGDIGLFKIVAESGVASGIRRIEAVTGDNAFIWLQETLQSFDQLAQQLNTNREQAAVKVENVLKKSRELEKELSQLKAKLASQASTDIESQAQDIDGIKVLAHKLEGVDPKSLRETLDRLKDKLSRRHVILSRAIVFH